MPTYLFFMQSDLNDERQNLKQREENTMALIFNFQFFSSHFHVTTLGPDLFSRVYLKKFTAFMVLVNFSHALFSL